MRPLAIVLDTEDRAGVEPEQEATALASPGH